MNAPSGVNTGFQLCDGSDSEGEVEDVSISPTLSHMEAPELQNISRIAKSIEAQEDFLTRMYEGVSGRFLDLSTYHRHQDIIIDVFQIFTRVFPSC